ncbi:MAG: OmpA family protein [Saprospiraceae bacterium]
MIFRFPNFLILSAVLLFAQDIVAQKAGLEVTRCTAVDRVLSLKNVTIEASGRKWAANANGIFHVKAADLSSPLKVGPGEKNVLAYRGGNTDFSWSEAAFRAQVPEPCSVTAAWYDAKSEELWLGTDEAGLYWFSTKPELKLKQRYTPANSKLKSNNITIIFQDASSRLWIGTDKGVMSGPPGRWKGDLPGTQVQRIREYNTVIYVLADGFISKAPGGEKWTDLALEEKYLEGDINDFDIDPTGKMWLVSGNLTRFDMISGTYDEFGGPEYYTSQYGNNIAAAPDGSVWVGTEDKGLYMVDKAYNMVLNAYVEKPISCEGNGKDAVLMAKVTGGLEPYTYAWTGGLSGPSPKDVPPGNYTVTVSDSKGKVRTSDIGVPDSRLKVKAKQKKPISAPGMTDGAAEVDLPTNAAGITVAWDNGEMLAAATKLGAGEHTVTVADAKGCTVILKVTISEVAQPVSASISEKTTIKCAGGKGTLALEIKGGKKPFAVKWSNPAITGETPDNVPAGNYSVTVTDATNATSTAVINVKQPEALVVSALVQAPASTGGSDGKALAQAKGGTGVFSFKWDNGETVFAATKLPPGNRSLTVTDANGCATTAEFVIPENVLTLTVSISEKSAIMCAGDKAALIVEAKGGKGNFKYTWSNPALSGKDPANVPAGDYVVTVTDGVGTSQTASIRVKTPQPLTASAIAQGVVSPGGADGKALCMTTGGALGKIGHNFLWDNGEITAATLRLTAGLHTVTVTDDNGCTTTASVMMTEEVLPLEITITEKSKIKCSGEKATLAVQITGGKGTIRYSWNEAALSGATPSAAAGNYVLTVMDELGTTKTASISVQSPPPLKLNIETQAPLSPGKSDGKALSKPSGGTSPYTHQWENGEITSAASRLGPGVTKVTVTDANGCTAVSSVTMSETFLPLTVSISEKTKIKCSGEKAALEVQVSGGKTDYRYAWNSPTLTGQTPNAAAGDYVLTVTDATGSTQTASVKVSAPAPLSLSVEAQGALSPGKSDGKAIAKPSGGTANYSFQWENGETANTALRLGPGITKVTVTDANGCAATASITMSETFLPLAVSISEKTKIKCSGEKAALEVQVSGGKSGYKYAWNNPSLSGELPSASAGDYILTVTDAKGASKTASINVQSPAPLVLKVEMQAPASAGKSDGKALAKPSGGTGSYIFQWESGESSNTASRLAPGSPKVTVTDANGCMAVGSVAITENILGLVVSISEKNPIKCGGLDKASLQVNISGGKPSYSLAWNSPAITGESPDGLVAGDYAVTVTDSKGTTQSAKITVKSPEPIALELVQNIGASSPTTNDGKAQISVKGGTTPYKVAWDTKQTGLTAPKLALGKHSVTVTDAAGCTQTLEVEIGRRAMPELTRAIQQGQTIPMRLLTFATDSASLRPAVYTYLDELYEFLSENPTITIEVGGHTNNQPNDDFADYLSTARAKAVANYLTEKGIDTSRVQYKGYGKKQPLVPNTTPEGRKTNQRVEIKILTAGGK